MVSGYITVTYGVRGYFAVHVVWDSKARIWEPWATHPCDHATYEEAVPDAKAWAEAEGLEFKEGRT